MLFRPEDHASNPPETWQVVKITPRLWHLVRADHQPGNGPIDSFTTKKAAEAAKVAGWAVTLYEKEGRWYAGEQVHPWRPWAEVKAEQEANKIHQTELAARKFLSDHVQVISVTIPRMVAS